MNKYNFDTKLERRYTHSYKWHIPRGAISLSIADTDFLVAKEIQQSIINRANRPTYGYTFVPHLPAYKHESTCLSQKLLPSYPMGTFIIKSAGQP